MISVTVISDTGVFDDEEKINREDFDEDGWFFSRCCLFDEDEEIDSCCCCSAIDYAVLIWTVCVTINWLETKEASHFCFFVVCELKNDWIVPRLGSLELFSISKLDKLFMK